MYYNGKHYEKYDNSLNKNNNSLNKNKINVI